MSGGFGYCPSYASDEDMTGTITTIESEYIMSDERDLDDRQLMETNISKIVNAVQSTKVGLKYSTDDAIEETALNVGPQHNLENQIKEKMNIVEKAKSAGAQVNDDVPEQVLVKLNEVTKIAREGNSSTFSASAAMETVMDAFQYGRKAALNQFDLRRSGRQKLREYDAMFVSMLQALLNWEVEMAESKGKECFGLLEEAKRKSDNDKDSLSERKEEEDQLVDLPGLEEINSTATTESQEEKMELTEIERNCGKDIVAIDSSLQELSSILESTLIMHETRRNDRAQKLSANRSEQKDLRERLRQLETEESEYLRVEDEEDKMVEQANIKYNQVESELIGYKERIATLKTQAKASLQILEVMKACTNDILADAKAKKKEWLSKLQELELESLMNTRDVLVATICLHKMEEEDCRNNLRTTEKDIEEANEDMIKFVKSKYIKKVEDLKGKLAEYEERKLTHSDKLAEHTSCIQSMSEELAKVTKEIKALKPNAKLTSVEGAYKLRIRVKDECFVKKSVEDAQKVLNSCSS